MQSEFSY